MNGRLPRLQLQLHRQSLRRGPPQRLKLLVLEEAAVAPGAVQRGDSIAVVRGPVAVLDFKRDLLKKDLFHL